jgi:hypothetical protein
MAHYGYNTQSLLVPTFAHLEGYFVCSLNPNPGGYKNRHSHTACSHIRLPADQDKANKKNVAIHLYYFSPF